MSPDGPVAIRPAATADLEAVVALAAARRRQYAAYQPVFWRPAVDAVDRHRPHLAALLAEEAAISLVAEVRGSVRGFVVGTLVAAPPVYDPGGPTCVVDDLAVADPADWPGVGGELLAAVRATAHERGAAQIVVVTAHLDVAERAALTAAGLSVASEWWVGPLDPG